MNNQYLLKLRNHESLSIKEQIAMIIQLSIPAIMAQLSSVVMQYIDASMVGQLGANDSAAIGLVSSTTWLLGGLCSALAIGFTVQNAYHIGAKDEKKARNIVSQGLIIGLIFGLLLLLIGCFIAPHLPVFLGGESDVCVKATQYFFVYALSLPFYQLHHLTCGMLQCSGNMKTPGILNVVMCFLDVVFNAIFIFPTTTYHIFGLKITIFGFDLGVLGASIGTSLSVVVVSLILLYIVLLKSPVLKRRRDEKIMIMKEDVKKAIKIATPVACEQVVLCGAYIMATKIVAPLGTIAIAANSFAVTAESLCYMPGYGIGNAATTIIGQSIGAKRNDLTKKLGWITTLFGMIVMGCSGILLYIFAPFMMSLLTKDVTIQQLGSSVLRIVAFAEPFYAGNIVASGVFRGAQDTFVPSCLNLISMWCVRIPLSMLLAPIYGLQGVWIAMTIELIVRGLLFLIRLGLPKSKWHQNK